MEPRALYVLHKGFVTQLYPNPESEMLGPHLLTLFHVLRSFLASPPKVLGLGLTGSP